LGISSRFPKQKEIVPVYAIIVLMVYGWTILKFNYNLPGWLYYLNLGEIMSVFAYSMATNLLESLVVLFGVVVAGFLLPRKLFSNAFVARAAALSILVLGLMMYIAEQFTTKDYYPAEIIRWGPAILVLIGLAVYMIGRMQFTRKALEFFADRAIIFLYISIPVSIFSLIVVLIRNIF
jgi:hypothetical protein